MVQIDEGSFHISGFLRRATWSLHLGGFLRDLSRMDQPRRLRGLTCRLNAGLNIESTSSGEVLRYGHVWRWSWHSISSG